MFSGKKEQAYPATGIALFLDTENLSIPSQELAIDKLIEYLNTVGTLVIRRAYGRWTNHEELRSRLLQHGIELISLPGAGSAKNRSDIRITVEAMELLYTRQNIQIFVVATGDGDFTALATRLSEYGKQVIGISSRNNASQSLQSACHFFLFWEDLANTGVGNLFNSSHCVKVGPDAMKSLLRKQNISPLSPKMRFEILANLLSIFKLHEKEAPSLGDLQKMLMEHYKSNQSMISGVKVKTVIKALFSEDTIQFKVAPDLPRLMQPVISMPDIKALDRAVCSYYIRRLLNTDALLEDEASLAELLYNDRKRSKEAVSLYKEVKSRKDSSTQKEESHELSE